MNDIYTINATNHDADLVRDKDLFLNRNPLQTPQVARLIP